MSYTYKLGKNYSDEYEEYGKQIISENKQLLKKAGIKSPVFDNDLKTENTGLVIEKTETDENKDNDKIEKNNKKTTFKESSISKNSTIHDVTSSTGMLNTIYKNSQKAYGTMPSDKIDDALDIDEFTNSLEESNGSDQNDDMAEFLSRDYEKGYHINGGGYTYYEEDSNLSTTAVAANITGSYKSKDERLTLSYGGSFEYSNHREFSDKTLENDNKSGNAILMAKYKAKDFTYAAGGIGNFYDDDSEQYNLYGGIMHNNTGIAATVRRNIFVSHDANGTSIKNKTDIKLHILKPKPAEEKNNAPESPSPESTKKYESHVRDNAQEVESIADEEGYGFGMNLKLTSATDSDEYGIQLKYASLITKKNDKKNKIVLTPYIELDDYHPNTDEGLKIRTGIIGKLAYSTDNNLNISAEAILDNKRIIQPGSNPEDTFMAVLDSTVSKNRISASVSTGYINSNSNIKYSFITGKLKYTMKNSSLTFGIGQQSYNDSSSKNKVFHTNLEYAINL